MYRAENRHLPHPGVPIQRVDLNFIKSHAAIVLETTPVNYLKSAQLRGSLFEEDPIDPSAISSVFTQFYVSHEEPLEALNEYRSIWPLGELLDGHEFFLLVRAQSSPPPSNQSPP